MAVLSVRHRQGSNARSRLRTYVETARSEGWDTAVRCMIASVPQSARSAEIRTLLDDSRAGWVFLLERPHGAVALDLGCGLGAVSMSLARHCASVVACDSVPERVQLVRERARTAGLRNLFCLCAGDTPCLPFPDGHFDFVVVTNSSEPTGARRGVDRDEQQRAFLQEIHRVLKPDGQLYMAAERDRQRTGLRAYLTRVPAPRRMLAAAGFSACRFYSLLPSVRIVDQIVDLSNRSQMRMALPLYRGQSRLRQSLLRGYWHQHLAPSVAVVASKRMPQSRFVDRLVRHVYSSIMATARVPAVRHYMLSQKGMLILQVDAGGIDVIIRVPLSPIARRHAERNATATREIHADDTIPSQVRERLPRPLDEGVYDGVAYFVETQIRGRGADTLDPPLLRDRAFRAGVGFAITLHGATSEALVDETAFDAVAGENINAVERLVHDEAYEAVFTYMRAYLRRELIGLPLVRQIGDFALSNLIIDPVDASLAGVIDWDRSRPQGLPLLDVVHLSASSSWAASMWAGDFVIRMFSAPPQDAAQHESLKTYRDHIGIPASAVRALCLAWWLDFINARLDTTAPLDDAWITRNVRNVLSNVSEPLRHLQSA